MESLDIKKGGLNASTLKIIAIVGMTLDHIGIVFGGRLPIGVTCALYAFGGLTFPIMAFLMGEGYRHTSNFKRYALRLLVFALISQLPYSWALYSQLNVLFTLLLGLIVLYLSDHMKSRGGFTALLVLIVVASLFCDWGGVGVPMVLLYHKLREQKGWGRYVIPYLLPLIALALPALVSFISTGNTALLPQVFFVLVGCTLTIPLLRAYNGQKGLGMKYFFYAYYPVHIAVLGVIRHFLFR